MLFRSSLCGSEVKKSERAGEDGDRREIGQAESSDVFCEVLRGEFSESDWIRIWVVEDCKLSLFESTNMKRIRRSSEKDN